MNFQGAFQLLPNSMSDNSFDCVVISIQTVVQRNTHTKKIRLLPYANVIIWQRLLIEVETKLVLKYYVQNTGFRKNKIDWR